MSQHVPTANVGLECAGFDCGSANREPMLTTECDQQKMRRQYLLLRLSFSLGVLFCAFLTMTEKAFSEIPRGVFCMLGVGGGVGPGPWVFSNPDVDGVSVREYWSNLEPVEGIYDWTYLDTVIARSAAAGKPVLLRIGTQANKPLWVAAAVAQAGGTFFTFDDDGVQTTIPVFWDPTFLAKKTAMIAALGAHFTNNPAVKIVSVSFANATSEDWTVPYTPTDVANWLAAGYTTQKMLDAGAAIVNATMAAFPNQYVTLAVGANGATLDPDPSYVARNAVLNARASWPGRLIVQKNSLATLIPAAPGTGSPWELIWNSRSDVAGQMIWWCYGDTTYRVNGGVRIDPSTALTNSVDKGLAYGMKYIEIYKSDVLNLQAATHYAHTALRSVGRAVVSDFNSDGHPDYVLRNPSTRQTAIWYLNNNIYQGGALGPSITAGWVLDGVADFNRDVHPDYALFNSTTDRTAIWYMSGPTRIASAYGPTLPGGWELVATGDFNNNGYPEYVLYNASTHQTAIWYLNNNVYVIGGYGPTLPVNWSLVGVTDFDRDGHRDYLLFNSSNHQTAIWYLSGRTFLRGAYGPTIPSGWALVATADFNSDGHPDYLLYNPAARQTGIWYLNNNVYVSAAFGPILPVGWSLVEH